MWTCDIRWLVAVEGHKPGDEQYEVAHDEMMDQWERMGLLRILTTTRPTAPTEAAPRKEWVAFLESRGVEYPAKATKAQLVEVWYGAD